MSRPQKIIPPIKGDFNSILSAVTIGQRQGQACGNQARQIKGGRPRHRGRHPTQRIKSHDSNARQLSQDCTWALSQPYLLRALRLWNR